MIEEFHEHVYPGRAQSSTPQDFIDNLLFPYAHALNNIVKANYQYGSSPSAKANAKEINSMFRWLNQLDRGQWTSPALYYFVKNHRQQQHLVVRFLVDLERLVVSFMICHVPPYKRIDRYCLLLEAISKDEDLFAPSSPLQLTHGERQEVLRVLNGDIYRLHYVCRYVLLRLDSFRSESGASYDYQTISIEHVLPQHPSLDSKWNQMFPSKEMRERYVHRLGNLVLLSKGKNMKAENFDFDEKKQKYFFADNVSTPFVLSNEVRDCKEWTPAIIDQRQRRLMDALQRLWRL
nr:HNH endonuclease family protein [Ktedonobacteraceae bacterium]